jgi:hypothetical protein
MIFSDKNAINHLVLSLELERNNEMFPGDTSHNSGITAQPHAAIYVWRG